MKTIREKLQAMEDEHIDGYKLKTNEEIIDIISEFGNGLTEFHTLDIERLIVENNRAKNNDNPFKDLEEQTDHNAKVVSAFMEHCKQEGFDLPDSLFESYFDA